MTINNTNLDTTNDDINCATIKEAIKIAGQVKNSKLTKADIYRHALYGNINLSIYFQSPIILRRVQTLNGKVKLKPVGSNIINQLCLLEKNCYVNKRNLIVSTTDKYIHPNQHIIDTTLIGYEYCLVQHLLARSLRLPLPIVGENYINYGITASLYGSVFQVFERITYLKRIKQQLMRLPENSASCIAEKVPCWKINKDSHRGYFPLHDLPQDACFVIRYAELEKLINMPAKSDTPKLSPTRISTPLSRLFWLACKNNEVISPLIKQPYKLLSIFEQWASAEGITDRLSGDTLKTALERGTPTTI